MLKIKLITSISLVFILAACGENEVETKPPAQVNVPNTSYSGPAAQTEDIQKYKSALFDNIANAERCGSCHKVDDQAPYFARFDDVNLAYAATTPLVDLAKPAQSRLVEKVAGGHNCWLDSDQACADTMTQWIKLWSDDRISTATTIELTAPIIREPGTSRSFPSSSSEFATHVYPVVSQYCASCHNETASAAQSPFFASNDIDIAYQAAQRVINLDQADLSRLVVRLGNEFHNCWSDCQANSNTMLSAIQAFSQQIPINEIDPGMVISKALKLTDGIVASSGGRFESDTIALYQFKTGNGNIAYDTSGVSPAANLSLNGDIEWLGSGGLIFNNGRAQASTANSKKLHNLITATGEFSLEAWLTPSNVTQEGPARIVSYSAGDTERNFTLGQSQYNYDFMLRNQATSLNGEPALSTPDADETLQSTLQHVVLTYNATEGRKIYVNGKLIEVVDQEIAPLASWDDSFALILGQEASNNHVWQGNIRLLALYNKAMTEAQIQQNFDVGVGERYYLLFSIGELIDLANTYVMFEISEFDNYSYLFSQPAIINLDQKKLNTALIIEGLNIGINGKESSQSQVYANLSRTLDSEDILNESQRLSELGTIIAIEKGAEQDEFFLSFERLGEHSNVKVEGDIVLTPETAATTESSDIGLRNFDEIHASMSQLTGVAQEQDKVFGVYQLIKRQLPSISNVETFISAQQMAITQLAIAYCDSAIEDVSLRSTWFPNINFNVEPNTAYATDQRAQFITPLLDQLMPLELASQPMKTDVSNELNNLIDRLAVCNTNCDAVRTRTIAKASCAAVLASAVTLVQ
ncbi:MAG: LamG domain-containing protein [Cognaticolwellia sp.]